MWVAGEGGVQELFLFLLSVEWFRVDDSHYPAVLTNLSCVLSLTSGVYVCGGALLGFPFIVLLNMGHGYEGEITLDG